MSMVINLVEDHNIYLCEGGPVYNGGVQPTPITYLTQWKIVGNSEVHGNEIWSCGEYSEADGKYHIVVQPLGKSVADIALTEPLRKVNDAADTIEFPSDTEGKALVTRNIGYYKITSDSVIGKDERADGYWRWRLRDLVNVAKTSNINILCSHYPTVDVGATYAASTSCIALVAGNAGAIIYDVNYKTENDLNAFKEYATNAGVEVVYVLITPTTELVDAPQIEEADSYSMVISHGAKAVSWSDFIYDSDYLLTDSENNILVDSENYQLTVQS